MAFFASFKIFFFLPASQQSDFDFIFAFDEVDPIVEHNVWKLVKNSFFFG